MGKLTLYVPKLDELWYRQAMMSDPATMSYNRGYDLAFSGYHPATGCIDFPETGWVEWYDSFIDREPQRYYAYLARKSDGVWIGEVNFHLNPDRGWHDIGIVIEARHRGNGCAAEALRLLAGHAFENAGVQRLHNDFETDRDAALRAHLSAGFAEYRRKNGLVELMLTRKQYMRQKQNGMDT